MRVIFDTNILILSQLGKPATSIMQAALMDTPVKSLAFYYSEIMLAEYRNALEQVCLDYPRDFYPNQVAHLLSEIERRGILIHPTIALTTEDENACIHEPDNRFLECAIEAQADYIITINTNHFPTIYQLPDNRVIKTVPPGRFERILFRD